MRREARASSSSSPVPPAVAVCRVSRSEARSRCPAARRWLAAARVRLEDRSWTT